MPFYNRTYTVLGVANPAGSGAGDSVSVDVTVNPLSGDGVSPLFPNGLADGYFVAIAPSQPCVWVVSNKSSTGFTVTLTPLSGTLAAGTFDVAVTV